MIDSRDLKNVFFRRVDNYIEILSDNDVIAKIPATANVFLKGDEFVFITVFDDRDPGLRVPYSSFDLTAFTPDATGQTTTLSMMNYLISNFFNA